MDPKELIERPKDPMISGGTIDGFKMRKEAAAVITALMEENAQLRAELEPYMKIGLSPAELDEHAYKLQTYNQIAAELEQVKRERDAAVADLKTMVDKHGECVGCKFGNGKEGCRDVECDTHAHNHWQWRGPMKEE